MPLEIRTRNLEFQPWSGAYRIPQDSVFVEQGAAGPPALPQREKGFIPFGRGLSFSDQCLSRGTQLVTERLSGIAHLDAEQGILECGAGTTFLEIMERTLPLGWLPPVLPSTKFLTVGGAIANDVHGRDHVHRGSFGNHSLGFTLQRTSGTIECGPDENPELFKATIGGMGLTGLITRATLQLKPAPSALLQYRALPFHSFQQGLELLYRHADWEYQSLWIDGIGSPAFERGYLLSHRPVEATETQLRRAPRRSIPFRLPRLLANPLTFGLVNRLHRRSRLVHREGVEDLNAGLYQMDSIENYQRLYPGGFAQLQFSVPEKNLNRSGEILKVLRDANALPFFCIAKRFGGTPARGLLSFPLPGITMAIDFPRQTLLRVYSLVEEKILELEGRVYLAKDMFLSPRGFSQMYPVAQFFPHVDPHFDSLCWQRLNRTTP